VDELDTQRRFFAEELQIAAHVRAPALLEAFATVPRERFLPPGPWVVRSEADLLGPLRRTPDADPRFVYHNVSIGLRPERMLFNGAPGFVGAVLEALALIPGDRVLHVGAGTGYYTAIAARTVGSGGRVLGIEIDAELAKDASANLRECGITPPWARVQQGDGTAIPEETFDAVLVNTGLTHIPRQWLDRLVSGGRVVAPLTVAQAVGVQAPGGSAMANISRGLMVLVTRTDDALRCDVRVLTFVSIFTALGIRDDATNAELARALAKAPLAPLKHLRFDPHDAGDSCWCHGPHGCWSTA
jgi:protein-L-isoaspartate(D-aspartate) O-methyltransferase